MIGALMMNVLMERGREMLSVVMLLIRSTFVTGLLRSAAASWSLPSDANAGV